MPENTRHIPVRFIDKYKPVGAWRAVLSAKPPETLENMTPVRAYLKGAARAVDLGATIDSDAVEELLDIIDDLAATMDPDTFNEFADIINDRISIASDWNAVGGDLAYALAKFKEKHGSGDAA